jgi:arabinogalactan oligomer/maltooligosaccharide transport system permease protein
MMKETVIGLNHKYLRLLPIAPVCFLLSFFLPYISWKPEGIRLSGLQLMLYAFRISQKQGNALYGIAAAVLLGIPLLLVLGAYGAAIVKTSKSTVKAAVVASVVQTAGATVFLFIIARLMNMMTNSNSNFLVKYCGIGFWCYLFMGFAGLVIVMQAAKISPGYIVLVILSIIWLFPITWVVLMSFRLENGSYTSYFFPKTFTLKNYHKLLTDSSTFPYVRWFLNTLFVAMCACILNAFIVLSTAFTLSRIRFQGRKAFMNVLLILGMFPGFMSMIAVYYILKGLGLTQSLIALILVYAGSGAMSYYIAKGFFDTIPKSLDEAALLDGATKWQLFTRITMPLSKPIIIYTILVAFTAPWGDYIFAKIIMGDNYQNYTVALGLFLMLDRANIDKWYTRFGAGAVLISIPIALLFIVLQKYYVEGLSGSVKG